MNYFLDLKRKIDVNEEITINRIAVGSILNLGIAIADANAYVGADLSGKVGHHQNGSKRPYHMIEKVRVVTKITMINLSLKWKNMKH